VVCKTVGGYGNSDGGKDDGGLGSGESCGNAPPPTPPPPLVNDVEVVLMAML